MQFYVFHNSDVCNSRMTRHPEVGLFAGASCHVANDLSPRNTSSLVSTNAMGKSFSMSLYERYRAPNWKSRTLYILAAWMKLFAVARSKRKFNNPVSFDEKRLAALRKE